MSRFQGLGGLGVIVYQSDNDQGCRKGTRGLLRLLGSPMALPVSILYQLDLSSSTATQ